MANRIDTHSLKILQEIEQRNRNKFNQMLRDIIMEEFGVYPGQFEQLSEDEQYWLMVKAHEHMVPSSQYQATLPGDPEERLHFNRQGYIDKQMEGKGIAELLKQAQEEDDMQQMREHNWRIVSDQRQRENEEALQTKARTARRNWIL
jgi:hypothetical protein